MPSVPISFKEVKEPVDSRWPYLKSLDKRKKGRKEKPESAKAERREKAKVQKEGTPREEW